MKVLINRQVVNAPWGGGNNFVRAFRDCLPALGHELVESLSQEPDVVLLVGVDADGMGVDAWSALKHRQRHSKCKVVLRLNDCDARKGTTGVDATLWSVAKNCDELVFVSCWLQQHLLERWLEIEFGSRFAMQFTRGSDRCEGFISSSHVIHNGVDKTLFHGPAGAEERNRLTVVTHHWSDNPLKGSDVYETLDSLSSVEFKYIGRHRCTFKNPHTRVVPPCHGEELVRELRTNSIYVTGTRWDPGPNHLVEALACGLPVWAHKDGGGAVEFAGEDHTFDDLQQLKEMFSMGSNHTDRGRRRHTPNTYKPMAWPECIERYVAVLEESHSK